MNKAMVGKLSQIHLSELCKHYGIKYETNINVRCPFPNHGAT